MNRKLGILLNPYRLNYLISRKFTENINSAEKIKEGIMQLSLLNVKKYGWTENCLKISANELGYTNQIVSLFREGPIELVNHTLDHWNNKLKREIETFNNEEKNLNFEEKIKKSLKIRLSYEIPFINNWSQAINLGLQKENIITTTRKLYEMVDSIIVLNSDNITDKESSVLRMILLKAFIISELHLLVDRSNDFVVTWKLIDTIWSINSNVSKHFNNVFLVGDSLIKLIGYASISLLSYDLTKIDQILNLQKEIYSESPKI